MQEQNNIHSKLEKRKMLVEFIGLAMDLFCIPYILDIFRLIDSPAYTGDVILLFIIDIAVILGITVISRGVHKRRDWSFSWGVAIGITMAAMNIYYYFNGEPFSIIKIIVGIVVVLTLVPNRRVFE